MGLFSFLKSKFSKKEQKEKEETKSYEKGLEKSRKAFASKLESLSKRYASVNEEYFEETFEEKKPIDVILFLENLDPSMNKTEFVRSVKEGTDKNWLIEMVEQAMTKVHKTPIEGDLYFDLLSKRYIIKSPYSEMEILEELSLSRARYYDKRWEALVMFGVCFWGGVLPNMKKTLMAS